MSFQDHEIKRPELKVFVLLKTIEVLVPLNKKGLTETKNVIYG